MAEHLPGKLLPTEEVLQLQPLHPECQAERAVPRREGLLQGYIRTTCQHQHPPVRQLPAV